MIFGWRNKSREDKRATKWYYNAWSKLPHVHVSNACHVVSIYPDAPVATAAHAAAATGRVGSSTLSDPERFVAVEIATRMMPSSPSSVVNKYPELDRSRHPSRRGEQQKKSIRHLAGFVRRNYTAVPLPHLPAVYPFPRIWNFMIFSNFVASNYSTCAKSVRKRFIFRTN